MRISKLTRLLTMAGGMTILAGQAVPGPERPRTAGPDTVALVAGLGPVLMVTAPDTAALLEALRGSEPGRQLGAGALPASGAKFFSAAFDFGAQYLAGVTGAELAAMLPKEYTFAVLPLPEDAGDLEVPDRLVVGRLPDTRLPKLWRKRLFPALRALDKNGQWSEKSVGDTPVYQMQKPGEAPTWLAFADGLLVSGTPGGVRRILAETDARASAPTVRTDFDRLGKDRLAAVFFDAGRAIGRTLEQLPADAKEVRDMQMFGSDGLKQIVGTLLKSDRRFEERLLLDARSDEGFEGILGLLQRTPPAAFRSADIAPADSLVYAALDLGSGENLLDGIRELAARRRGDQGGAAVATFLQMLGAQFGIDMVQDVFGNIGAELFVALRPRVPGGPRWKGSKRELRAEMTGVAGIQVKNAEAARQTLQRVLQSPVFVAFGLGTTEETYNGTTIHLVTVSQFPGNNKRGPVTVAYAFVDDFLVVAETAQIKILVDCIAGGKVLGKSTSFRGTVDGDLSPALLRLYLDVRPVLSQLAPQLAKKIPPPAAPLVPNLTAALRAVGPARLDVRPSQGGLALQANVPVPVLSILLAGAAADHVGKPPVERRVKLARERMKVVAGALRRYYRRNGEAPPDSLLQLAPGILEEVPGDPFNGDEMFGYGVAPGGAGWVLTSVGPDGRADLDVDAYQPSEWQKLQRAETPEDRETAKALIYRFRPKQFPDERALDDEGDIVRIGSW
ncbi:MAG: hypothetical protein GXP31_18260 [Kiritimatiellaeota bacterium]|nr:hypothetical protein [Kiritimatiellota bacterium]